MGKPTGFLEFDRLGNSSVDPKERIKNFSEFHPPLVKAERQKQAARCMNCGVPFCQSGENFGGMFSGCPLHNLIPEWNDEIYKDHWDEALSRLLKTNNFPEFTGRVCPALCEAACTCGMNGDSVTVHDNELSIIEEGFATGMMKPRIPKQRSGKRVAVIGSGPSGLAVADQLNKRGHSVVVYERDARPGGLLMYGIPNMKLDKSVVRRRVELMEKEGVVFTCGVNVGKDISADEIMREFDAVVLCCGSKTPRDLKVPGRDAKGVHFAVDYLSAATSTVIGDVDGFEIDAKGKHVVIVGGGDTGNDCVGTSVRQGCKSVTQLEMMPKMPDKRAENNPWPQWPRVCKTDYGQEEAISVFGADPRMYQTTVTELVTDKNKKLTAVKIVSLGADRKPVPGSEQTLDCDLLIIAAGFLGCQAYVPDAFGVAQTPRTVVQTEAGHYATNVPHVFTAGDMHRGQSLVVWAIAEGRGAAREVDAFLMGYTNL